MSRSPGAGFTLLELLVAITLLGLLMTMAFSGLRLGTRAWEVAEDRDHDVYLVQQLLRQHLGAAFVPSGFGPAEPVGDDALLFEGDAEHVTFVAPLPDLYGVAGLHWVTIELAETGDGRRELAMAWRLWRPDEPATAAGEDNRRVLLEDARAGGFSFFGPEEELGERAAWQDAWQGRPDLPVLIRLDLDPPKQPWPPLIVAPVTRAIVF